MSGIYGCRNWVEYGLNQSKNELGWADFRLTAIKILKVVGDSFSAYLLGLFAEPERNLERNATKILGAKVRERLGDIHNGILELAGKPGSIISA